MSQVDELLAKYREKNEELAKRLHALPNQAPGIRMLEVKKTDKGSQVSCRLDRAPLDVVVRRILSDADVSFMYERAGPNGRVTAAFQNQPLVSALNILLEPFEYQAIEINSVVVVRAIPIGWKPPAPMQAPSAPSGGTSSAVESGGASTQVGTTSPTASPPTPMNKPTSPSAASGPPTASPSPAPPSAAGVASPTALPSTSAPSLPATGTVAAASGSNPPAPPAPPPPPASDGTAAAAMPSTPTPSASASSATVGSPQPTSFPGTTATENDSSLNSKQPESPSGHTAGAVATENASVAPKTSELGSAGIPPIGAAGNPPASPEVSPITAPPTASEGTQSDLLTALNESSDTGTTYRVITPLYVPVDYILTNILSPLYPSGGTNTIQYGIVPETNQVFLYGPANEVARAVRIVRDADVEPVHIYFEAALVSFTSEVSEVVASALQNLAYKQYSNVNLTPGFPQSPDVSNAGTFSFLRDSLDDNPLSFGALINSLVSINQARILSRPYLFTLNGNTATLSVGDKGFVQVSNSSSATGRTTSANSITVGTNLSLTPTALPDGTIRVVCDISQSQLVPASAQLDAETENAEAKTVLQVRDGESILIGGLNSQESNLQSYGFPYLEKIPLLNFLFKSIYNTYFQEQVFVYITPRIWRPSLEGPVQPRPEVPFQGRLNVLNRPYE